jgi:hypothetical protein
VNRRDTVRFLVALGATAGPLRALAQGQIIRKPYRIALVPDFSPVWEAGLLKPFTEALRESGRIEARDYVFYRSGVFYGPDTALALERALQARSSASSST